MFYTVSTSFYHFSDFPSHARPPYNFSSSPDTFSLPLMSNMDIFKHRVSFQLRNKDSVTIENHSLYECQMFFESV